MNPPPPTPDHHDVDVRQVLENLEAGRPVARDDLRIVERVDERESALCDQLLELLEGLADVLAVKDDLRAVALRGVDL